MSIDARDRPAAKLASHDRDFEPAVREGLLTAREAIRRGNRQAYAEHIARRYRLSHDMALLVTDNRLRLTDALRAAGRIPGHPELRGGIDAPRRLQALTLVLGLLALSGLFGFQEWQRQQKVGRSLEALQVPAPPATLPAAGGTDGAVSAGPRTSIERDGRGRITRVTAGRPADVLAALCEATPTGACGMMEIQPTEPPLPGRRIGRFALEPGAEQREPLTIRRDRESGRWIVGTGLRPIVTDPAADSSAGAWQELQSLCEFSTDSDCAATDYDLPAD